MRGYCRLYMRIFFGCDIDLEELLFYYPIYDNYYYNSVRIDYNGNINPYMVMEHIYRIILVILYLGYL